MVKYLYDKHKVKVVETCTTRYETSEEPYDDARHGGITGYIYAISFDKSNCTFVASGPQGMLRDNGRIHQLTGGGKSQVTHGIFGGEYHKTITRIIPEKEKEKGDYIETVTAEDGTYPDDGIKDGYWYVKKGVANAEPTLTLNTPMSQTLFENDNLSLDGTAHDADKGDVVIVKAKIADSKVINLATKVSDGKPFDYSNTFLFKQGRLWQGNNPITGVLDGTGYKIEVWAEDDKGGKSKTETRSFSGVANRPPIVKVTKTPSFTNATNSQKLEVAGTITDPDGHDVTVTVKLNDLPQREVNVTAGEWSYVFAPSDLKKGANEISIIGRDEYGMTHTKTVKINNTIRVTDMSHVPVVALFDIPLEGVESDGAVMWLRRQSDNTTLDARIATAGKKEEDFKPMQKTTHTVGNTPRDQFAGQTGVKSKNVTVEITSTGNHSLLMIQGVVK